MNQTKAEINTTCDACGTFACPICGQATPHGHSDAVITAWRSDQCRSDGWRTINVYQQPSETGWYLARGHTLGDDAWERSVKTLRRAPFVNMPAEILYFDKLHGWFVPITFSTRSGRDVHVQVAPTHWREVPSFQMATP